VLRIRAIRAASPNPRPTDWGLRRRQDGRAAGGRLPRALGFPRSSRCVDWVVPIVPCRSAFGLGASTTPPCIRLSPVGDFQV
jgi:hypothetical protein